MERIAILDHDEHRLYVEDIPDEILDSPEWSGEEEYIKANYDMEHYSWDYIVDAEYFPENRSYNTPIEINFEDIASI